DEAMGVAAEKVVAGVLTDVTEASEVAVDGDCGRIARDCRIVGDRRTLRSALADTVEQCMDPRWRIRHRRHIVHPIQVALCEASLGLCLFVQLAHPPTPRYLRTMCE